MEALVIAFVGHKGGTAKTHGTTQTGTTLARDARVLCIETDKDSSSTLSYVKMRRDKRDLIEPKIEEYSGAELTEKLPWLKRQYDYIVIDSAGNGEAVRRAMLHADIVVAPVIPTAEAVDGYFNTMKALKAIRKARRYPIPLVSYFTGITPGKYLEINERMYIDTVRKYAHSSAGKCLDHMLKRSKLYGNAYLAGKGLLELLPQEINDPKRDAAKLFSDQEALRTLLQELFTAIGDLTGRDLPTVGEMHHGHETCAS